MSCKNILLFYELHQDKLPSDTITDTLKLLNGYKMDTSVCLEEPTDHTKQHTYDTVVNQHHQITSKPINSFFHPYVQNIATRIEVGGKRFTSFSEMSNSLSDIQKQQVVEYVKSFAQGMSKSLAATIGIIEQTPRYCNMDVPTKIRATLDSQYTATEASNIRDSYMADKIAYECNEVDDFTIALVGAKHFSIAKKLKKAGYNVNEFWVIGIREKHFSNEDKSLLCMLNPKELLDTEHKNLCENYTGGTRIFDTTDSKMTSQDIVKQIISCGDTPTICDSLSRSNTLFTLAGCIDKCTILPTNDDL